MGSKGCHCFSCQNKHQFWGPRGSFKKKSFKNHWHWPIDPQKKIMTPDAIDLEYSKGCPPWFGHILQLRPGYAWPLRGTQHRVYARPGATPLGDRTSTLRHAKMTIHHPLIIHLTMRFRRRFLEGIIHATQGELLVPCLGKFQAGKETCRVHGMVAKLSVVYRFTLPWPNQSKIWRNLEFLRVSYGVAHPTISWLKFQVWPRPYKIHQNPTILKEHQVIAPKWRFKILHVMQNNWGHGKPHDERLLTRLASRSSSFQKNHSTNQTSSCFLFLTFYPRSISTSEDPRSTVFYTANPFAEMSKTLWMPGQGKT